MAPDLPFLLAAGFAAGAMNALAGGGSFASLPALIAAGVPPVAANASSTVALFPGGAASVWVYRDGLRDVAGVPLRPAILITLIGGAIGSLLLLWTPGAWFDKALPWLLLVVTLMLAFGRNAGVWLRARVRTGPATVLTIQLLLGIYCGYFGGAAGLMMAAAWSMLDTVDLKALSPPRTLMVTAGNGVAVLIFVILGAVRWAQTIPVAIGALVGGAAGAVLGRRLDPLLMRGITIAVAVAITTAFFIRAYR